MATSILSSLSMSILIAIFALSGFTLTTPCVVKEIVRGFLLLFVTRFVPIIKNSKTTDIIPRIFSSIF